MRIPEGYLLGLARRGKEGCLHLKKKGAKILDAQRATIINRIDLASQQVMPNAMRHTCFNIMRQQACHLGLIGERDRLAIHATHHDAAMTYKNAYLHNNGIWIGMGRTAVLPVIVKKTTQRTNSPGLSRVDGLTQIWRKVMFRLPPW